MLDLNYFIPLIGKRFGSPEFGAAIEQLEQATDRSLSHHLVHALPPQACAADSPLKRLYPNERVLVISSGNEVLATYRAYAPYEDQTDKYHEGDVPYIMPRYKLTQGFDKSLTAYLLYYLSITAHRYLEVIKSFYATPEGAELDYDRETTIETTKTKLKDLLELKNAFRKKDDPEGELKNQKRACKRNYKSLLNNLADIILRRAEPDISRIDDIIHKAFIPFSPNSDGAIHGPNEEMEIMIRYNILALKLIVHDFNKLNGKPVDLTQHSADKKEFESLNLYLMSKPEFIPTKSDGKITEPSKPQIAEFSEIMWEIHGEIGKVGGVLMWVEKSEKRTLEQAFAGREVMGYAMLENRIQKISRCAYYIDSAHITITSTIRGREELNEAVQEFIDAAKLKVFTSAGSPRFNGVCERFTAKSTALENLAAAPETHLKAADKSTINTFISVVSSMTETKRRQENALDKIKNADAFKQR